MGFDLLFAQATNGTPGVQWIDKIARTPLSIILMFVAVCSVIRVLLHFTVLKPLPVHYRSQWFKPMAAVNELCDAIIYAGVFVFMVIRPFVMQTFVIPSGSMVKTLLVGDYIVANKFAYRLGNPRDGDIIVFKPPLAAKETIAMSHNNPGEVDDDVDYIKRLIGSPGDLIEIKDDKLYRNGTVVEEPYIHFTKHNPAYAPTDEKYVDETPEEIARTRHLDFKIVKYNGEYIPLTMDSTGLANASAPDWSPAAKYVLTDITVMQKMRALPAERIPEGYYLFMGDNRNGSFDGRFWGLVPRSSIVGKAEFIWFPFSRIGAIKPVPSTPGQ